MIDMNNPKIDETTVGDFYLDNENRLYRLLSYTNRPTAGFQRILTSGEQREKVDLHGAVGCLLFADLKHLIPEENK